MATLIRRMTESDIVPVKQIELGCGLSPWSVEDYLAEAQKADSFCTVASENGNVFGFIVASINSCEHTAEIYNLGVLPTKRGLGLGSALILELVKECKLRRVKVMFLEVRASNSIAIGFYKSIGFETMGKRSNFYSNPTEDALLMKLAILQE